MLSIRFRPKIIHCHPTLRSKITHTSFQRSRFSDLKSESKLDNQNIVDHIESTKKLIQSVQKVEGVKLISHATGEDTKRLLERLDNAQQLIKKLQDKENEKKKKEDKQPSPDWLGGIGIHEVNWLESVQYSLSNARLLWLLVALQSALWGAWYLNEDSLDGTKFMVDNFMLTAENLQHGRFHTLVTSIFSHFDVVELLEAATLVLGFGTAVTRWSSVRHALILYLAGGVAAASTFCGVQYYRSATRGHDSSLKAQYYGAGGGVISMMTAAAYLRPMSNLYLFMAPIPSALPLIGLGIVDAAKVSSKNGDEKVPQVASHLAAIAVGAVYSSLMLTKKAIK